MSIFVGTIKEIDRKALSATKKQIFNTNRIGELKADSSDSVFIYTDNKFDRREAAHEYKVDETKATLDAQWGGNGNELVVSALKKKLDSQTKDYAETITVNLDDIYGGYSDTDDSDKTWLKLYPNTFKKVEYQVDAPIDYFNGLSNFLSYSFLDSVNGAAINADAVGTIDYANKTIAVTVNSGATVTGLKATFTVSTGCTVYVSSTAQVSGSTANNFSSPVTYILTGANGVAVNWVVTVTVAS